VRAKFSEALGPLRGLRRANQKPWPYGETASGPLEAYSGYLQGKPLYCPYF